MLVPRYLPFAFELLDCRPVAELFSSAAVSGLILLPVLDRELL